MTQYLLLFLLSFAAPKPKANYPYAIYLPKDYQQNHKKYPVVIYLHGGSQKGNDLNKLKVYGYPKLIAEGSDYPCIIAMPQCPDEKVWSTDNWQDSLLYELTTKYRIDTNRIYLTGISMGGYGVWRTAVAYPTKFAALMPLCGGCDDSLSICTIRHVPIWTFHGTADDKVDVNETERLVRRLEACDGHVQFTRLEGEGHEIQYLFEKPELIAWLLKQKK